MTVTGVGTVRPTETASRAETPDRVLDAARPFEALLITELMRTMREAGSSGWLGTDTGDAGGRAMEYAEEIFAQGLAAQGGIGFASMIEAGLRQPGPEKQNATKSAATT